METIALGGRRVRGFGLGSPTSPDIYNFGLNGDQQAWVRNALVGISTRVQPGCPTWADPNVVVPPAAACFQNWWNANYSGPGKPGITLRTDGTVDEDTLCALQTIASIFPIAAARFPDPTGQFCKPPTPITQSASSALVSNSGSGGGVALSSPAWLAVIATGTAVGMVTNALHAPRWASWAAGIGSALFLVPVRVVRQGA